ncbi:hypothetical protein B0H12DRAFT_1239676 [Mycena haematopus]|nr:hypothetical protein B0H12DRAFT_1239676 [Mycena haematopus]
MDPNTAIEQLLGAFEESKNRVKSLEETLIRERQAAQDALRTHAKLLEETAVRERQATETEILALREEIAVLRTDSARMQKKEEEEDALHLREKYEALKTRHRELKHALSELNATQAELVSNATAYENLALDAAQAKGVVDEALRDLQARYDALKVKKTHKSSKSSFEQVEALTADVDRLTEELDKANKQVPPSPFCRPHSQLIPVVHLVGESFQEAFSGLDKVYKEELELSEDLQKRYDKLSATNKEVTTKYLALKTAGSTSTMELKKSCDDLNAQNSKLHQEHQALLAIKNATEKAVIAAAEKMNEEMIQLRVTVKTLQDDARIRENRLDGAMNVNQAFRHCIQNGRVSTSVARVLYDDFMHTFPSFVLGRPDFCSLQTVAKIDVNLAKYLAADSVCAGAVHSALYWPKRTVWSSADRLHMLAFAATHQYHARGTWTQTPDISGLVGSWREVFINVEDWIFYVGTYRCHDLRCLCPGGTPPPDVVSPFEMLRAARLEVLPPEERSAVIRYFFPSGIIDADCMGLHCVGFNGTLYDALQRWRIKRESEHDLIPVEWQRDGKRQRLDIEIHPNNTL